MYAFQCSKITYTMHSVFTLHALTVHPGNTNKIYENINLLKLTQYELNINTSDQMIIKGHLYSIQTIYLDAKYTNCFRNYS